VQIGKLQAAIINQTSLSRL